MSSMLKKCKKTVLSLILACSIANIASEIQATKPFYEVIGELTLTLGFSVVAGLTTASLINYLQEKIAQYRNHQKVTKVDENSLPGIFIGNVPPAVDNLITILNNPQQAQRFQVALPKGILLYGKPGNGKTALAREVARRANAYFMAYSAPKFISKWLGETAANIRQAFDTARAYSKKHKRKVIIFIDEFDSLAMKREFEITERRDGVNELLTQMDGFAQDNSVIVIAATNNPEMLDDAVKRSGRFDYIIEIVMPDVKARKDVLQHYVTHQIDTVYIDQSISFDDYALYTEGFSYADLKTMSEIARQKAFYDKAEKISSQHLNYALRLVQEKKKI